MSTASGDVGEVFQAVYIAKQKPAPPPVADNMKATLQSYPPLGQTTPYAGKDVHIVALLEVPKERAAEPWEVSAWHSVDKEPWVGVKCFPLEHPREPQDLQQAPESQVRFYFTASFSFKECLQFTLRFRHDPHVEWRWIRDEQGLDDGVIVKTNSAPSSSDLSELIPDIHVTDWHISPQLSQSPGTTLWSLEASIGAAEQDESAYRDIKIGTPWGSFLRWFALVRLWTPWLAPRQGKSSFSLDKDAVLCSFLSPRGKSLVFLAISGVDHVLPLFRSASGHALSVHARNDGLSEGKVQVLVSEGDRFESAVAAVMYHARSLVTRSMQTSSGRQQELVGLAGEIKPQWMEYWYDGLGFCTWNALGQKLTEQKVMDALDRLTQNDIKVSSLIIDDNWQSIDYRGSGQFQHGWSDFEAEPKAFPDGLKATVSRIKSQHPHIHHIAVWHALLGYWAGLAPDGKLAQAYQTVEVAREDVDPRNLPIDGKLTVVAKDDVSRFYNDFYRFLSDCGIDAVKTDAQYMVETLISASSRRELITEYLDAWTISTLRYFSAKAISCMSQFPQALFHSQLPMSRPPLLVRNSDDFFPEIPASHPWHVWTNAHNSLLTCYLNVLPDWDMFQTVHEYSGFHAAARCVSGGPIYITDVPGEHDMRLINQMTGSTPRGNTVIFRPSVVGKAINPYVGYEDDVLLKVGSYHGASQTGTPILAVFNISTRPLTELIPLSSFSGCDASLQYVVRAHTTGKVSKPVSTKPADALIIGSLPVRGFEIFTAYPLTTIASKKHGQMLTANLGLIGKMTGAAAIFTNKVEQRENGRALIDTRIKAFGILGIYLSSLPDMTIEGDFLVLVRERPIPVHTVAISAMDNHVLEVDIGRAWEEMGLEGSWSNEIEVKVFFNT